MMIFIIGQGERMLRVREIRVPTTDGNLTAHMRTLQEAGYVSVTKAFQDGRPLTTYSLTRAGRKAFAGYIDLLEQIVQQTKPKTPS